MSREQDAKVAEALGWSNIFMSPITGTLIGKPPDSVRNEPLPHYSTSPADALAALEATGEEYDIMRRKPPMEPYWAWVGDMRAVSAPDLCTAAVAAILAWHAAKGGRGE